MTQLAGKLPPEKHVGAAYDSRSGVIHVFGAMPASPGAPVGRTNNEAASNLRHEVGHAIDHYFNDVSQTPYFVEAYRSDVNAVRDRSALKADDQHYLSSPQEAFAEAIARRLEGKNAGVLQNSTRYLDRSQPIQQLLRP